MRLTNYLRDCFIRAVSNDLPEPTKPTYEDIQKALYDNFATSVKVVYDNPATQNVLKTSWVYLGDGNGQTLITASQNYENLPIYVEYQEACKKRQAAIGSLRSVANGRTTLKQLQEALPELVKYMADEKKKPTPGLPVVANVYADLKALGLK